MIRGRDLIGRPVVSVDTAVRLASVQDLVFDHAANVLLALLVDEGGWFRSARVVPYSEVRSIGDDAIMVASEHSVMPAKQDDRVAQVLQEHVTLSGMHFMTTDGKDLGRLADVFFDETSGKVVGYDMTGGLFSDISSGRTFVPAPEQLTVGSAAVLVPPDVASQMQEQQPGGLRGALDRAGQSVSAAAGNVAEGVRSAAGSVAESVRSGYENVTQASHERQKAFVVGREAGSDVSGDDDVVIVRAGEQVTQAQAEAAEAAGKLGALVLSVGGGAVQQGWDSARDAVTGGYDSVASAAREQQKAFVVGRVAGSDVSNTDGAPIVKAGDSVTDEQAEAAESAGKLGALVLSVGGGAVQQGWQTTRDAVAGGYQNITQASHEQQKAFVIGRVAARDVTAADQTEIVKAGQIITDLQAEIAEDKGALGALVLSAGGGAVQQGWNAAKGAVAGGYENVTQASHEQQKAFVTGRVAGSEVSSDEGIVIVQAGDSVTTEQAALAEQAGKLSALVLSVGGGAVQQGWQTTRDAVAGGYESVAGATRERQKAFAVGKVASGDVTDDRGVTLVRAGDTITSAQADEAERAGQLTRLVAVAGGGAVRGLIQNAQGQLAESRLQRAEGRRVQHDVRTPGGGFLAAQGQIVTPALIQRAQDLGQEDALLQATSAPATPTFNAAGERLAEGAQNLRQGASSLAQRTREWFDDQREQAVSAAEERQIQHALGRPTTRVILDPEDRIILNVGEIITHKAIGMARQSGVLSMLLDSVSRAEQQLTPAEARPAGHGEAALESQQAAGEPGASADPPDKP